jgi:hypothetical protein
VFVFGGAPYRIHAVRERGPLLPAPIAPTANLKYKKLVVDVVLKVREAFVGQLIAVCESTRDQVTLSFDPKILKSTGDLEDQ